MSNYLVSDTDLGAIADAIRAKSGGSEQLAFPAGFVSEVQSIPTGSPGDIHISGVNRAQLDLEYATLSKNIVIDAPDVTLGISRFLQRATASNNGTEVTINAYRIVGSTTTSSVTVDIQNIEQTLTKVTKLTLNTSADYPYVSAGTQFLYSGTIQRCLGSPIRVWSFGTTASNKKFNSANLVEFYLYPNYVTTGGEVSTGVLVDAALVSLINGLKEGLETAQTLTLKDATTKANCSTIMGDVSEAERDGTTYHVFTQNQQSGTVSLLQFATNTKGWTIA